MGESESPAGEAEALKNRRRRVGDREVAHFHVRIECFEADGAGGRAWEAADGHCSAVGRNDSSRSVSSSSELGAVGADGALVRQPADAVELRARRRRLRRARRLVKARRVEM